MKISQPSKSTSSVDTLSRTYERLFSCSHTDLDALIGPAKNSGKGAKVMPGKVFPALKLQFSRFPHKMMLKNSVLINQRQMDFPVFAINNTDARTLSNLDTRYSAWSALYDTMKNDSVQEPVKYSVM